MVDYTKHDEVIAVLERDQAAEHDQRKEAREAHVFIDKKDGQWEDGVLKSSDKKPRYTFDMTGAIVDQVAGEIEEKDFSIKVRAAGGDATKESAKTIDGIVRGIENLSDSDDIFEDAARNMITAGMAGWRIVSKHVDARSFDQDLIIEPVNNFIDRVWFDRGSTRRDRRDSNHATVLSAKITEDYKELFPKGSGVSVSTGHDQSDYIDPKENVVVGQIYYIVTTERELLLLSDSRIVENDDNWKKSEAENLEKGVTISRRRTRPVNRVWTRLFDGKDWLNEPEETPFQWVPVIPCYANYKIIENLFLYRGIVQRMMDPQRVLNYSLSREIEEGALAPRQKLAMTKKMAEGHAQELATLNTNMDPVLFYEADPNQPGGPFMIGGAQINPGLRVISDGMQGLMNSTAGMFAANMGDNPGLQSGVAIQRLQNTGDRGNNKFSKALKVAISHTCKIIVDSIPIVYDTERMLRVVQRDGTMSMEMMNTTVFDQETNEPVMLNDLSKGLYDVTCEVGPSFSSKQQETVAGLVEVASVDPAIGAMSGDILTANIAAPGMDELSERIRAQYIAQGIIPIEQMTDEEKQKLAAQQQAAQAQEGEKTPDQLIGEAEFIKAKNEEKKTDIDVAVKGATLQLKGKELELKQAQIVSTQRQGAAKIQAQAKQDTATNTMAMLKFLADQNTEQAKTNKVMIESLEILTRAIGQNAPATIQQVALVDDSQGDIQS